MSWLSLFFIVTTTLFSIIHVQGSTDRTISLVNQSGSKVEIYWVHPQTKEYVLQSDPFVYNGATFNLNSYVDHSFEVREMKGKTGKCAGQDDTCRVGFFQVNTNSDQVIFVDKKFRLKHQDNKSIARESASEMISDCEVDVMEEIKNKNLSTKDAISSMKECVETGVAIEMEKSNEEIAFQSKIRKEMGEHFENYTCADYGLETNEPESEGVWRHNGLRYNIQIMLNRPASKIHLVENFITEEECNAMEEQAQPKLHQATVADGKGGSELSPNRKAMQAGIRIPWHLESEGNALTTLSRRVYDYVNHVLDMHIDEHGQEDLMSIQYEGRGEDEEAPDRYTPHCDGDCDGMDFKTGNRVATMVIYCKIPEKGGATNFRNSGIHIQPKVGSATFFSYINPQTFKMDMGFTEHSGCPVIEGEKKIVTQWVRYGVDKMNPWSSFNTLGIHKSMENN